jgi:hypothetical protein
MKFNLNIWFKFFESYKTKTKIQEIPNKNKTVGLFWFCLDFLKFHFQIQSKRISNSYTQTLLFVNLNETGNLIDSFKIVIALRL